jgi:hypothetical protein
MNPYRPQGLAKEQVETCAEVAPKSYGQAFASYAENDGFAKGYCFGHDWFEGGKAPYPVFSVKTGELVLPEKE